MRRALLLWFSGAARHPFLSGGEDNLLPAEKTSIAKHWLQSNPFSIEIYQISIYFCLREMVQGHLTGHSI
jgi:hypothetical protein